MKRNFLAKSFNKISESYDRYRPGYPLELIDYIIKTSKINKRSKILEIGCGTGKATALFLRKGFHVTAVEPGKNLIEAAQKNLNKYKEIDIVNKKFEAAKLKSDYYDLVFSASAFHWVDPEIGIKKLKNILKPEGYFAFFWSHTDYDHSEVWRKIKKVFQKYYHLNNFAATNNSHSNLALQKIKNSNFFNKIESRAFPVYGSIKLKDYFELIKTYSWIAVMNKKRQSEFIKELSDFLKKDLNIKRTNKLIIGRKR